MSFNLKCFFNHLRDWTFQVRSSRINCSWPEALHFVVVVDQVVEKSEELHGERREAGCEPSTTSAVEILHVNSAILAAHSDYFMRMFSNGMSESSSGVAVVHVSEEGRPNVCQSLVSLRTSHVVDQKVGAIRSFLKNIM